MGEERDELTVSAHARTPQDFSSDLSRWENSIKAKDASLRSVKAKKPWTGKPNATKQHKTTSAGAHTYDTGYKKWESFDVDGALEAVDSGRPPASLTAEAPAQPAPPASPAPGPVTPASIVAPFLARAGDAPASAPRFPAAAPQAAKARDVLERERGNDYYKRGNFEQAVKFYSRAIGFNPRSTAAYSNRAMALLKLKEFANAEADCSSALALDAAHVKSLTRRGTARNALGRHRAAFADFARVCELQPANKLAVAERARTRELIRSCVRRGPRRRVSIARTAPTAALEHPSTTVASRQKRSGEENSGKDEGEAVAASASASVSAPRSLTSEATPPDVATSSTVTTTRTMPLSATATEKQPKATADAARPPPTAVGDSAAARLRLQLASQQTPETLSSFERLWRELREQPELRGKLVAEGLGPSGVGRIFKNEEPEATLFCELVESLAAYAADGGDAAAAVARAVVAVLDKVKRIDITLMMLGKDKERLRPIVADGTLQLCSPDSKLHKLFS